MAQSGSIAIGRCPATISILAVAFIATLLGLPIAAQLVSDASSLATVAEAKINPNLIRVSLTDGKNSRFTQISVEAGLSQTRVSRIIQDGQGFMWFGTQYGLDRYDGYKFKVFTPDPGNANSLSCASVASLFRDRSGILWMGCDQFLDRFDPTTEKFTHIRVESQAGKAPPIVFQITQDHTGTLWLTTGSGLYGLNPQTLRITSHFVHDPQSPLSLQSNGVLASAEAQDGKFWVADGNSLEQLDLGSGKVKVRVSLGRSPINSSFFCVDRFGTLWVGYMAGGAGGMASFDPKTNTLSRYSFYDHASGKPVETGLHTIFEDRRGSLWLATTGEGLIQFDPEHATAIRYRHSPADPESIADDRVIALGEDREGNIWAGLHAREPSFLSTTPVPFKSPLPAGLSPNSLGESIVDSIYEDKQGILWVGTAATLTRIDRTTGEFESYRPPDAGPNNDLISITPDSAGFLWVGSFGQGLYRFDPRTARFKTFRRAAPDSLRLSNNAIIGIFIDHRGTMWLATWNGLVRFDPVSGQFEVHKRDMQSFGEHYYDVAEDKDGNLWLGGKSGLQKFDPVSDTFTGYEHRIDDPGSLSDNTVTSVYIDGSGAVWAGTYYGLNKLDRTRGTFSRYFAKDGLPSSRVNCILGDRRGNLWLSTNRGLARFDQKANTFANYSVADGLPGMDFTGWRTCSESATGEMFFGGFSGATSFFPDQVSPRSDVPPIVFTDFRLLGHSVEAGTAGSPLKKSIGFTDDLVLSNKENVFSLEFAAVNFSHPSIIRYRYRLEGVSSQWTEVGGDQRIVNFSSLPPGAYTFRVQTAIAEGGWSAPGALLRIRILPPWWNSSWFIILCVFLIGAMTFGFYQYRMAQVRRRFELRFEERLGERTRIAREFHDTLLQTIQGSKLVADQAQDDLNDPAKTKGSLRRLSQWLDRAVLEGRAALDSLRGSATETEDLAAALRRAAEADAPVSMRVAVTVIGVAQSMHPIAREEVFRIGEEAIRNACHHSGAKTLEVELRYTSNLALLVQDDGCGFDPLMPCVRPGHFGISGMRERAANIGGRLVFDVSRHKGTCLTLTVPGHLIFNSSAASRSSRILHKSAS